MKTINTYINEKLRLTNKRTYTCQPKDKIELRKIIIDRIKKEGNECDINDIDVSKITDMSRLFDVGPSFVGGHPAFKDFNCDISMWDVSNVKDMGYMFLGCTEFNCDLSKWNVSNVENMGHMFCECERFNCDLSKWDVSNVENMFFMFHRCKKFNQDLNSWDVSNVKDMYYEFEYCPTSPTWYDKDKWEPE
jgi:surface protein